ncbi:MAG TPA: hypothetical protein VHQ69_11800 [Methylomirabilota bacterium]|jgi:hypothetical protein|nr:hypothetical protein [Methylomirabilota bacterium]
MPPIPARALASDRLRTFVQEACGPNELLHIPTVVWVTACVAEILADHHRATRDG